MNLVLLIFIPLGLFLGNYLSGSEMTNLTSSEGITTAFLFGGIALLVYFIGFFTNSDSNNNSNAACELSFEKAEILFDNQIFDYSNYYLKNLKYKILDC